MSGPLCGAFLQPCFGSWSDQLQSRWGRRKPFIITGTLILVISILSLAWAKSLSRLLVFASATPATHRACLVTITMFSTLSMWVAVQPVQIGLRTLITDDCTKSEQAKANAWAGGYSNLAAAWANLAAYMDLLPHAGVPYRSDHTIFMDLSLLASLVLTITIAVSCVSVREKRLPSAMSTPAGIASHAASLRAMWRLIFGKPSQIRTVYLVQFFAWLGWFPFLYYAVTYGFRNPFFRFVLSPKD